MYKFFKKVLWSLICITIILSLSVSVLKYLFPPSYYATLDKYCSKYGVDTYLALALAKAESNFDKEAVSRAGAKGIMQLTDDTFDFCTKNAKLENDDIFDPDTNIHAGVWYLSYLLKKYDGNTQNSLAAYNAGTGTVDKWLKDDSYSENGETLSDIPYAETKRYTKKITQYRKIYNILY